MIAKKSAVRPASKNANISGAKPGGIELYLKRIFSLMFGAVGLTAISAYATLRWGLPLVFNATFTGYSVLFYIIMFGGLALAIYTQVRIFRMKPVTAGLLLAIYSIAIGFTMAPLVAFSLAVNPWTIIYAFVIAAVMFGCMALFGYKTAKNLSFLGIFLFMGMIGLILVGLISLIWPLGSTFATIVCLIGVLVFALFTAYDMQNLKQAYAVVNDETQKNQLAVLGALHLYISFIAMFQYILSLLNRN